MAEAPGRTPAAAALGFCFFLWTSFLFPCPLHSLNVSLCFVLHDNVLEAVPVNVPGCIMNEDIQLENNGNR